MRLAASAIATALAAAACQSSSPPVAAGPSAFYQYAGSRQCERGGKTLEALKQELSAAGVQVQSAWCAHDGRMYAQSCGSPDGRLLVVQVLPAHAALATRLGLEPLRGLPESVAVSCR